MKLNLKRINSFVVSILVASCENRQYSVLADGCLWIYNLIHHMGFAIAWIYFNQDKEKNKEDHTRLIYQGYESDQMDQDSYGLNQDELKFFFFFYLY